MRRDIRSQHRERRRGFHGRFREIDPRAQRRRADPQPLIRRCAATSLGGRNKPKPNGAFPNPLVRASIPAVRQLEPFQSQFISVRPGRPAPTALVARRSPATRTEDFRRPSKPALRPCVSTDLANPRVRLDSAPRRAAAFAVEYTDSPTESRQSLPLWNSRNINTINLSIALRNCPHKRLTGCSIVSDDLGHWT